MFDKTLYRLYRKFHFSTASKALVFPRTEALCYSVQLQCCSITIVMSEYFCKNKDLFNLGKVTSGALKY